MPGRVALLVASLTQEPEVQSSIPGKTFVSPSADSRRTVVSYWSKYVHEVLPRKSVARFIYRPDMTLHGPGRVAQSVGHLTRKSEVLGSIPGLATYFRFSFRFFKKGSCQLLAKVCARSTG